MTSPGEEALGLLIDRSSHLHPDDLPGAVADSLTLLGGTDVVLFLADIAQDVLVPYGLPDAPPVEIDGTVAGRAFRSNEHVELDTEDGSRRLWLPVLDGSDRLGVLGVTLPDTTHLDAARRVAALTGELVVSRSQYGDNVVMGRRVRPLSIAAELRWAMLPPLTFETQAVRVAAILEPAYDVAGDSFDYSVTSENTRFAVFDAMGHGLEASRIANLVAAGYRNARRLDLDLVDKYHHITAALQSEFDEAKFATGVLADLVMGSGELRLLLAGHPPPLLLRGKRVVGQLECRPTTPFGIGDHDPYVGSFQLEPGDRIVLYTDGVVEARRSNGEAFGLERLADFVVRAEASEEPMAETMRRVAKAMLAHQEGQLQDDATLLMVHWRP